jgi:hypothetical protein
LAEQYLIRQRYVNFLYSFTTYENGRGSFSARCLVVGRIAVSF